MADVTGVLGASEEGGDGDLQEVIEHWVTVMDQWVRKFDRQTGAREEGGADPAGEAGSPTGPAPAPTA